MTTKMSHTGANIGRRTFFSGSTAVLAAGVAASRASAQAESGPIFKRDYVPVPDRARPPEFPESGYIRDDLGGGIHGLRHAWGPNSMFMVTGEGVVVVDGPSASHLMAAIREVTDLPVTHFIYSHPHSDHTGGAGGLIAENADGSSPVYIAHERAAARIQRANDPRRPVPSQVFSDQYVLETGGKTLILDYHGDLHSAGDIFIFAPEQKVLMLVDVVAPRWAPYYKLGHTPDVQLFMEVPKLILSYDFTTFVGGHAGLFGTRADIEEIGLYLADLEAACRQAFTENNVDYSWFDPDNAWAGSQVYYETLARQAAEYMPKKWLTELGGADVFLESNTHSLVYSLYTDYAEAAAAQ